ncbi:phage/plasmid primase, P4 family [Paraburkholderia azotifigens]|uniref:DNA primase family protein n=1 Tax=Paraburkholderia azotifigens TaxID=2057004 RepID=UPI00317028DF
MARAFDPHAYALAIKSLGDYASESKLLYRWTGTHWQVVDEDEAERHAYEWIVANAPGHASANNARQAVRSALLFQPRLASPTAEVVVPVTNGYVHVDGLSVALKFADRGLGIRHVLNCGYEPGAVAPMFEAFLSRAIPDDAVRKRVQEYIGYTFLADARFQQAQLWLGEGANGKGVLANIVQALHGNIAAVNLDALDGFKLSVLVGANLIYADEVPRTRINEQLIKSMIAGERVQVDRKHKDPLSIHIRGKWVVCGNHLPAVVDHSTGFWRRWDIVPFGETVPASERDPLLASRIIRGELAGVLVWALEGLVRLLARGGFEPELPAAMKAALQEAKADTNSVAAWSGECAIGLTNSHVPKKEVFDHYRNWCIENALQPLGSVQFWKRVRELHRGIVHERHRIDGQQEHTCNVLLPRRPRTMPMPALLDV